MTWIWTRETNSFFQLHLQTHLFEGEEKEEE